MLTLAIFFVAGILLGWIGLRLLNRWERRQAGENRPNNIFRHHS